MTDATTLSTVTTVDAADAFLITSNANGDVRRVPRSVLLSTVSAAVGGLVSQYASPLTGTTVTISAANTWMILTPAGTISALTVVLPTGADQQEVIITSSAIITALTISGTVNGAPTTMSAGGFARFRYDGVLNIWRRAG